MDRIKKIKIDTWYLLVVIAWPFFLFFKKLGVGSLSGNDEIIYAGVAQKIISTGDWLTMHYKDVEWFHKPPLLMWLTAASYLGFGTSTFTSRLVSATAGVLTCVLIYLLGRRLIDRNAGLIAALVLATNQFILQYGRQGMTDTLLILFCLIAIYGYTYVKDDGRYWWASLAALGLAVMTKGAAAVPILLIYALIVVWDQRVSFLRNKDFWIGLGIFAIIVIPWHLAMVGLHKNFIDEYLGYHVIKRAELPIEGHTGGVLYYAKIMHHLFYPWALFAAVATAVTIKKFIKDHRNLAYVIPIAGALVTIGFYTIVKTKLDWYIMPAIPFFALMIGGIFTSASRKLMGYEYVLILLSASYVALHQKPKSQILFLIVLALSIYYRKHKNAAVISVYSLLGWLLFVSFLSIRALII